MGWNLNNAQFSDRMAEVRGLMQIQGPTDTAEHLYSAVAQSNVPLDRLRGKRGPLQVKTVEPSLAVGGGYELGNYRREGRLTRRPARINLAHNEPDAMAQTFLHELGHHASRLAGTARYGTARQRGAEEARADMFSGRTVPGAEERHPHGLGMSQRRSRQFQAAYRETLGR